MIVLDTNVVSELFARKADARVIDWINAQEARDVFLSSIVLAELYYGAYIAVPQSRQTGLLQVISRLCSQFEQRVLTFDMPAAERYGMVTAHRRSIGRPIETKDAMIAAICLTHDATLATRNLRDFEELEMKTFNPFPADN